MDAAAAAAAAGKRVRRRPELYAAEPAPAPSVARRLAEEEQQRQQQQRAAAQARPAAPAPAAQPRKRPQQQPQRGSPQARNAAAPSGGHSTRAPAPAAGPQPMDLEAAARPAAAAKPAEPGTPLRFTMGHDGGRSSGARAAGGTRAASATPYRGVSTGRQRRKPEAYIAVPSHKDEERLARERQQQEQRAAQQAGKQAARAVPQPPEQQQRQPSVPPPAPQQAQHPQQLTQTSGAPPPLPPQQLPAQLQPPQPYQAATALDARSLKQSAWVAEDGGVLWRLSNNCRMRADLPLAAMRRWRLPRQTTAVFVLPDGAEHDCTLKRHCDGRAGMRGWAAVVEAMELQGDDTIRLHAGPLARGEPLRVQLGIVQRSAPRQQAQQQQQGEQRQAAVASSSQASLLPPTELASRSSLPADELPSFQRTRAADSTDKGGDGEQQSPAPSATTTVASLREMPC